MRNQTLFYILTAIIFIVGSVIYWAIPGHEIMMFGVILIGVAFCGFMCIQLEIAEQNRYTKSV